MLTLLKASTKPSMMNPEGGKVSTMPGMDMPGGNKAGDTKSMPAKDTPVDTKSKDDKSMAGMDMPTDPKPGKNNTPSDNTISQTIKHATFNVSGNCEMCKDRIEEAAKTVKGVTTAVWDEKSKNMNIEYNNAHTSTETVQKAIARVGHDTGKYKADDKVYNSLPACCKYRKS